MAEINASMVMKLRKISGQGMMDCKKALTEAAGDVDKAMDILRKKGMATLSKRTARETTEGIVVAATSPDARTAAMATLCCETDFVARSSDFIKAAETLAEYALACPQNGGIENILATTIAGRKFSEILTETVSKTGEKTGVGDFAKFSLDGAGLIGIYVHFNKKVGSMVQIETNDQSIAESDALRQAANDIAMHITATKPLALDKDGIDAGLIDKEKAIFAEQMKDKPANIIDKIVEGKMKKFYAENCLLLQPFVKDDSKTVAQFIEQAGKDAGGNAKIKRYVRFDVG